MKYSEDLFSLKIDIHTHIIPEELPDFKKKFGYGGFVSLDRYKPHNAKMMIDGSFFREIQNNTWDPKVRIQECEKDNVNIQVLSTIPVMFSYWAKPEDTLELAKFLNDHIAKVVKNNPQKFVGLGTLPMQDPELAIEELERCMKDLGLAGIQIGSHVNVWNLDDEHIFPILKAAEKYNAAVFVHPWDMLAKERMPKYWLPWLVGMPTETAIAISSMIFGGIFERLPNLRVAFAHGGGAFPGIIGRIEHGFQVRPDLCAVDNDVNPRAYLGKFYIDSLVHDPKMLFYLIDLVGADKIALGSDYPFPLGEEHPGSLIESMVGLSESTKALLLYKSALMWLGLQKKDFI